VSLPESLVAAVRQLLIVPGVGQADDIWLWEHTQRVMQLARLLSLLPEAREIGADQPSLDGTTLGALFADVGWAAQVRSGEINHWHVLSRPTNDIQRELAVRALKEHAGECMPTETVEIAAGAIRECNNRYARQVEARILSEAENLDEIGILYILRQNRQFQADGAPMDQLVVNWGRHLEYHYWDARINDCLRWETTRHIARERLRAVGQFMEALARDRGALDLQNALENMGVDTISISDESA